MPIKVLIADDSATVRVVVKHILSTRPDLEVCGEAIDGVETVEKAKLLEPDLILMDFSMPIMNGAEAASAIKNRFPKTSIILFTMYGESLGKSLLSATGIDAVLTKPEGLSELLSTIDRTLASKHKPSANANVAPSTVSS